MASKLPLTFTLKSKKEFKSEFTAEQTILDAKKFVGNKYHIDPKKVELIGNTGPFPDETLIKDVPEARVVLLFKDGSDSKCIWPCIGIMSALLVGAAAVAVFIIKKKK